MRGRVDFTEYLDVHYVPGTGEILIFSAGLVGGGLGFLWYNAPPSANDPVSPIKTAAGGALYHKNPRPAPISAATNTVISPVPGT